MIGVLLIGLIGFQASLWAQEAPPAAETPPTASQILDHFIEVTGGQAAREKINNRVAEGRMEYPGTTVRGKVTFYAERPAKQVRIIDIPDRGVAQEGTNGKIAWEVSRSGARLMDGQALQRRLHEAKFDSIWDWRGKYPVIEAAGEEKVNGQPCYRIRLSVPSTESVLTRYYDKKTGLLVKTAQMIREGHQIVRLEETYADYKPVGEVLEPHEIRRRVLDQEAVFKFDRIAHNTQLPAGCFELPEEVAKLVKGSNLARPASTPAPASGTPDAAQPAGENKLDSAPAPAPAPTPAPAPEQDKPAQPADKPEGAGEQAPPQSPPDHP